MARFLTAPKICSLILIESYLEHDQDPFTRSSLLDVITQQLHPPDSIHASTPQNDVSSFSAPLSVIPSTTPGQSYYDNFIQILWTTADLDQFHTLFDRIHTILNLDPPENRKVTPASPIGLFLRRSSIEWTRLHFADSLALLTSYRTYISLTHHLWTSLDPSAAATYASNPNTVTTVPTSASTTTTPFSSASDMDAALSISIHHLQKLGQRLPPTLKSNISAWLCEQRESSTQNLAHFMSFFEAWRAGQYSLALENLHRYFDYSLAAKGMTGPESARVYYQYALLHLSVLHADFERWGESVAAMEECVATARENQDTACLNFALSWLLYLRQAHSTKDASSLRSLAALAGEGGNEQDELAFLKAKAKDSKHWSLVSSTLLEEAKLELRQTGVSPKSLEHVLQSAHLNLQHASYSLMPASTIFLGSIYERLGQSHTSDRLNSLIPSTFSPHTSLGDLVRAQCRSAYSLARAGAYKSAQTVLTELHAKVRGTLKLEQRVSAFSLLVVLLRSLRQQDIPSATSHLALLRPLRSSSDPEVALQTDLLSIHLETSRCNYATALAQTNALLTLSKTRPHDADLQTTLHLLTTKASLFSCAGSPRRGFTIALRAASTAERANCFPVLFEALAVLAEVLVDLGEFVGAREVVEAVLPHVQESPPSLIPLAARLYTTLASSHAGAANPALNTLPQDQESHLRQALTLAKKAGESYAEVEDVGGVGVGLGMRKRLAAVLDDEDEIASAEKDRRALDVRRQGLEITS